MLVEALKSGKITISQNNKEAVELNVSEKHIDANVKDKEFVKELVSASTSREGTNKQGPLEGLHRSIDILRVARKQRPMVKEIVEDFCREGVTITVSYKGDRVVTLGSEADAKLTRLVTGTKGIEINSLRRLAEMGL